MKHTIVENPKTKIRKIRRVLKYRKNPSTLTTGRRMGSRRRATRSKKEVSKGTKAEARDLTKSTSTSLLCQEKRST